MSCPHVVLKLNPLTTFHLIVTVQYLLQMRSFLFFFSFSDEHLCALFQILFSNFLQNKIATFFCNLPDYKNYLTYVVKYFSYEL